MLIPDLNQVTLIDPAQRRLLEVDIALWEQKYPQRSSPTSKLLRDFRTFAELYLKLFERVISEPGELDRPSDEFIRGQALQRILDEWMIISQVLEQREVRQYSEWLERIEAQTADLLPKDAPPVVTYLGRAPTLRHLPFSTTSVASIPREAFGDDQEALVAMGHEVGHHLWRLSTPDRRSAKQQKSIRLVTEEYLENGDFGNKRQQIAQLVDAWLEELFADVYGAYKGTDEQVLSSIRLLQRRIGQRDELFQTDGEHPFPYFRPLVRLQVRKIIRARNPGGAASATDLDSAWNDLLSKFDVKPDTVTVLFYVPGDRHDEKFPHEDRRTTEGDHWHYWEAVELSLAELTRAMTSVVADVLFPHVEYLHNALAESIASSSYFTFNWLIESYLIDTLKLIANPITDFATLLQLSISRLLGDQAEGVGSGGGKFTGQHTHDRSTHTHK